MAAQISGLARGGTWGGGDGGREGSVTVDHMLECLPRGGKKRKGNWAALKLKICKKFFQIPKSLFPKTKRAFL